jgi:hypothetical protein
MWRLFLSGMLLNKNIKIFLNYFLGPVLFVWLSYSIYQQVINQPHLSRSWNSIQNALTGEQWWKFPVILILMVVNWGVEARKWQVLLKPVEKISWFRSFKATLTGVAFALNTPNRIGEYGGRVLYVREGNRLKAISLTLVGSMSQFLVTMVIGCGGLLFLLNLPEAATPFIQTKSYRFWIRLLLNTIAIFSIAGMLIYFRLGWIIRLIDKLPALKKVTPHIEVLESLTAGLLLRLCSLSLTRYFVFAVQYVLMIQLLDVNIQAWPAFWLVSVMFLVLAIVPTIALAELGLRGQVSLELFGIYSSNKLAITASAAGIWVINLVLPALIGSLLTLSIKIFKNK